MFGQNIKDRAKVGSFVFTSDLLTNDETDVLKSRVGVVSGSNLNVGILMQDILKSTGNFSDVCILLD